MLDQEQRLRLSIQKGSRLGEKSEALLRAGGLKFQGFDGSARLFSPVSGFPLDIYFDRHNDIGENVEAGVTHLGIVGQNIVRESRVNVTELMALGFGRCRLVVAAPENITSVEQLRGGTIVTSYPNSADDHFGSRGVNVSIAERSGSIESYVGRGFDGIVDIVDTGRTLREQGLFEVEEIYRSEAVLVADPNLKNIRGAERVVLSIVRRILSAQRAEGKTYIALNAPTKAIPLIAERIPGETSPTVSRLKKRGWSAVSVVVPKDQLDEIVDDIQECGAEKIVELAMPRMFPDKNDPEVLEIMSKFYK
jgi:ATP phosphoribosyltransferase